MDIRYLVQIQSCVINPVYVCEHFPGKGKYVLAVACAVTKNDMLPITSLYTMSPPLFQHNYHQSFLDVFYLC